MSSLRSATTLTNLARVVSTRTGIDSDVISEWSRQQPMTFLVVAVVGGVIADATLRQATVFMPMDVSTSLRGALWLGLMASFSSVILFGGKLFSSTTLAVTLLAMAVSFGGLNHFLQSYRYGNAGILRVLQDQPKPAIVRGTMDSLPELRRHPFASQRLRQNQSPWQTKLTVSLSEIRNGVSFQPIDGRLQVFVNGDFTGARPNRLLEFYGSIRGVGKATNPGETDFSAYYRGERLHGQMHVDGVDHVVELQANAPEYSPITWIHSLAKRGREGLLGSLDQKTGPTAVALVLGQRDFVDTKLRDQLLVTGTMHLLSVSGMHLAIVVGMAIWIAVLCQFPMPGKVALVFGVCFFYCAITGSRPPVMRAAVLVTTVLLATWMRRPSNIINTLSMAGLILVVVNPENVFNTGVQLSFLAVATLILSAGTRAGGHVSLEQTVEHEKRLTELAQSSQPLFQRRLRNGFTAAGKLAWASLCVTVISLPIVWYHFNVVSLVSVPTNVALSPMLVVALASGIFTAACSIVCPPATFIPAAVCQAALSLMQWVIEVAAAMPGGHFWLPSPPAWWVATFYVGIVTMIWLPRNRRSRVLRFTWIGIWMVVAVLAATTPSSLDDGVLEATFVDVGHGTGVVLRTDDEVWMYDCGRLGNDVGSSRDINGVLWSMGITRLDGIIISHADSDHFNALPGLLTRFRVGKIVTPPGMLNEPESAIEEIREAIADTGIPVIERSRGEMIASNSIPMHVVHPPAVRIEGSDNANSLIVRMNVGDRVLMLPGDLEPPGTDVLLSQPRPTPGGVLMAPHHGSLRMNAEAVLDWMRPSQTIVSGGRRAGRPEVTDLLASRGSEVHVTDTDGAIRVRIDADGIVEIRRFITSPW